LFQKFLYSSKLFNKVTKF